MKFRIAIDAMKSRHFSYVTIYNVKLKEVMYHSTVNNMDIVNFFNDLQIPTNGTKIQVSIDHPIYFVLKNLGYQIRET